MSKVFNGIETRAMKSSRIRKSKSDTVDAEVITATLMLPEKMRLTIPQNIFPT